jgi:hypothetical protein
MAEIANMADKCIFLHLGFNSTKIAEIAVFFLKIQNAGNTSFLFKMVEEFKIAAFEYSSYFNSILWQKETNESLRM